MAKRKVLSSSGKEQEHYADLFRKVVNLEVSMEAVVESELRKQQWAGSYLGSGINAALCSRLIAAFRQDGVRQLRVRLAELEAAQPKDLGVIEQHERAIAALEDYPLDFLSSILLDQSKGWIDKLKMHGADQETELLIHQVRLFWGQDKPRFGEWDLFQYLPFPDFFRVGGRLGTGRLPQAVIDRQPLFFRTPVCELSARVGTMLEAMDQTLANLEFAMIRQFPPLIVDRYRLPNRQHHRALVAFAIQISKFWRTEWVDVIERRQFFAWSEEEQRQFRLALVDRINEAVATSPWAQFRNHIAVLLAKWAYPGRYLEPRRSSQTGEIQRVDGMLFSAFGLDLAHVFDEVGWSGHVVQVHLLPRYRHLGRALVEVEVCEGAIWRKSSGTLIGTCESEAFAGYDVADQAGERLSFSMDHGLITLKLPHPWILGQEVKPEQWVLAVPGVVPQVVATAEVTQPEMVMVEVPPSGALVSEAEAMADPNGTYVPVEGGLFRRL